jgi:hypothetical protein
MKLETCLDQENSLRKSSSNLSCLEYEILMTIGFNYSIIEEELDCLRSFIKDFV